MGLWGHNSILLCLILAFVSLLQQQRSICCCIFAAAAAFYLLLCLCWIGSCLIAAVSLLQQQHSIRFYIFAAAAAFCSPLCLCCCGSSSLQRILLLAIGRCCSSKVCEEEDTRAAAAKGSKFKQTNHRVHRPLSLLLLPLFEWWMVYY